MAAGNRLRQSSAGAVRTELWGGEWTFVAGATRPDKRLSTRLREGQQGLRTCSPERDDIDLNRHCERSKAIEIDTNDNQPQNADDLRVVRRPARRNWAKLHPSGQKPTLLCGRRSIGPDRIEYPENPMKSAFMVRSRRLELPRPFGHNDLNVARLPVPPRPHIMKSRNGSGTG